MAVLLQGAVAQSIDNNRLEMQVALWENRCCKPEMNF